MSTKKMILFYGFSALATIILFSLLNVNWVDGIIIFSMGGLYITFFDKLQGIFDSKPIIKDEEEDGLGY